MKDEALNKIIHDIVDSYTHVGIINSHGKELFPSRASIKILLNELKDILYPGYYESDLITEGQILKKTEESILSFKDKLQNEVEKSFLWESSSDKKSKKEIIEYSKRITMDFLAYLPNLRLLLKEDAEVIFEGDPAAKYITEVVLAYPGFHAIMVYRIAHFLFQKGVPLIPRIMTEISHTETGVDIHPGADIGRGFCIDHGTGIVIGETSVIGDYVKLYQGVTLGAFSVSKDKCKKKRHPTIKNNVTIYARCTILGGDTVIGENSVIGGNVWITESLPKNSTIYLSPDHIQVIKKRA